MKITKTLFENEIRLRGSCNLVNLTICIEQAEENIESRRCWQVLLSYILITEDILEEAHA